MPVLYFAYGSNMSGARLRSRIASAEVVGPAFLKDMEMLFNKRGSDGSGKANLVESPGGVTWGVLWKISPRDLDTLDKVEGGYDRVAVQAWKSDGNVVGAVTYVSGRLSDDPRAYEWYKEIVIAGAREHDLPRDYIAYLERFPSKPGGTESEAIG
jgi:gamma-glutamylcyclotransferase